MRIVEPRFSVPFSIFKEKMTPNSRNLLVFLFSLSDFKGMARVSYKDIREGTGIGSDATVKSALSFLRKKGWIFFTKRGGPRSNIIFLEIPTRLRKKDVPHRVHIERAKTVKSLQKVVEFPRALSGT